MSVNARTAERAQGLRLEIETLIGHLVRTQWRNCRVLALFQGGRCTMVDSPDIGGIGEKKAHWMLGDVGGRIEL